jgi:hypothetical protein
LKDEALRLRALQQGEEFLLAAVLQQVLRPRQSRASDERARFPGCRSAKRDEGNAAGYGDEGSGKGIAYCLVAPAEHVPSAPRSARVVDHVRAVDPGE